MGKNLAHPTVSPHLSTRTADPNYLFFDDNGPERTVCVAGLDRPAGDLGHLQRVDAKRPNGLADRCAALQGCDASRQRRPTGCILCPNLRQVWVGSDAGRQQTWLAATRGNPTHVTDLATDHICQAIHCLYLSMAIALDHMPYIATHHMPVDCLAGRKLCPLYTVCPRSPAVQRRISGLGNWWTPYVTLPTFYNGYLRIIKKMA
jgi:hypothetical protein